MSRIVLNIQDNELLSQLASTAARKDVEKTVKATEEQERSDLGLANLARDAIAKEKQARQHVFELRKTRQAERDDCWRSEWSSSFRDYATADYFGQAQKQNKFATEIVWLTTGLQLSDQERMPQLLLRGMEADADHLQSQGSSLAARALLAALERHDAAKALIEADGIAHLGPAGIAYELLMKSHFYHRRSAEMRFRIEEEVKRIATIKGMEHQK